MSDIDFDELDKAVNSLIHKQKTESSDGGMRPASVEVQSRPVPARGSEVAARSDVPVSADLTIVEPMVRPTVDPAPSPAIRRSTGRVMDVVPPSAIARRDLGSPRRVSSRDSGVIEPTSSDLAERVEAEISAPSEEVAIDIDRAIFEDATPAIDPMKTPFLTDVEVSKRPLGAGVEESPVQEESSPEVQSDDFDPGAYAAEVLIASGSVAPMESTPEMSPELMSTESDASAMVSSGQSTAPEEVSDVLPEGGLSEAIDLEIGAEVVQSDVEPQGWAAEDVGNVSVEPEVPAPITQDRPTLGPSQQPGDILPQYTAEVAESPEPISIFEAASEPPKDLEHPEKSKPGWTVIVWIAALVLLGAAGGVGAWYFLIK